MCKGMEKSPCTCLKRTKSIRTRIRVFLQKPGVQAAGRDGKNAAAAGESRPSAKEVEKWKESFSYLMSSDCGRKIFGRFLKSEYSEENMEFWVACDNYKKTSASKQGSKAKQIYHQYVEINAPHEVNLDATTRESTKKNVGDAQQACFDGAQKMIYKLMEKDSYRRFLNSKLIQDLCQRKSDK
ncbi:regulator of G-protein signaling 4-like [Antennarius striatus]|uniref:regulator of G-protein signaling 4-like n=1 Tax=Antennarius striatus TaxID=241820 RepID=UPI0035B4D2D3